MMHTSLNLDLRVVFFLSAGESEDDDDDDGLYRSSSLDEREKGGGGVEKSKAIERKRRGGGGERTEAEQGPLLKLDALCSGGPLEVTGRRPRSSEVLVPAEASCPPAPRLGPFPS